MQHVTLPTHNISNKRKEKKKEGTPNLKPVVIGKGEVINHQAHLPTTGNMKTCKCTYMYMYVHMSFILHTCVVIFSETS